MLLVIVVTVLSYVPVIESCAAGKLRLLMNSAGRKAALAALILMLIMSVN